MRRPPSNPQYWDLNDEYTGGVLNLSIPWDPDSRATLDATIVRDEACRWDTILFGLGPDGTPDTSPIYLNAPVGVTTVPAQDLADIGLGTVDAIQPLQVTAAKLH